MLRQTITRRIVLLAAVACVVGTVGALAASFVASRELGFDRVAELVVSSGTARAAVECREGHFAFDGPGEVAYRAFGERGQALDGGPALEGDAMVNPGRVPAIERGAGRWMRIVFPVAEGPCRWMEARWAPRAGTRLTFWATIAFATLVLLGLVVAFVQRLVARPLLDRLEALRRRAADVGTERYTRGAPWGDEMDAIARALDEADRNGKERVEREASHARTLDAFVADVAHDVRTPLASLALALDEIAEDAPVRAMPALTRALNDVVYLGSLTQNLGLVRQMGSGSPSDSTSEIALGTILARVVQRAEPFALRRGITLHTELVEVPPVLGGELASEQAISNLVENAVAHGQAGNEVRITLSVGEQGIEIAIDDDGEGVSDADLARLGERSFRTDRARTRDQRGTGLGLSITRSVAERSGWALGFARSARGGLRATLRIPVRRDGSST